MHLRSDACIRVERGGAALAASRDERTRLRGAGAGRLHIVLGSTDQLHSLPYLICGQVFAV